MLFSFHSRKMQPLAALVVIHAEAYAPVWAVTPTPTTSSTPAIKPVFAKLSPTDAITQVSGQPDRGSVLNCLILPPFDLPGCNRPRMSPDKRTLPLTVITVSDHCLPVHPPGWRSKMQKSLQMRACLKFNLTVLRETDFTT